MMVKLFEQLTDWIAIDWFLSYQLSVISSQLHCAQAGDGTIVSSGPLLLPGILIKVWGLIA